MSKQKKEKSEGSAHYKSGGIEVLDVMKAKMSRAQLEGFYLGNIIKYPLRFNQTLEPDDIRKTRHYCDLLLRLWEEE